MSGLVGDKNRRILVIDDNPSIHQDFRNVLVQDRESTSLTDLEVTLFGEAPPTESLFQYELDCADQGEVGLEKLRDALRNQCPYAVAFVDMRMPPGWDGLETIERLWQEDSRLQVVICTAYSDYSWSEIVQRLKLRDQFLILKKPFDTAEVCQLAAALSEKWELTQQTQLQLVDLERAVQERTEEIRAKDERLSHKQRLETIGTLAGGVAHEYNNLLQAIQGYIGFVLPELRPGSQGYQDLRQALEAARRASTISGQLLKFSRRQPAHRAEVDLNELVSAALQWLRPLLTEQIDLDLSLGDSLTVFADAEMLEQALVNLLVNASDAMSGCGKLSVSTCHLQLRDPRAAESSGLNVPAGDYALVTVSDTGCGMSPEVLPRIFDPFFTTKEVGKGTGLGLAIVYGTIQQHEGEIQVRSEVGSGTTFEIAIPLSQSCSSSALSARPDLTLELATNR